MDCPVTRQSNDPVSEITDTYPMIMTSHSYKLLSSTKPFHGKKSLLSII